MSSEMAGAFFYGEQCTIEYASAPGSTAGASIQIANQDTQIVFRWKDVQLEVNMDQSWDRKVQLAGIRGWLERFPTHERCAGQTVQFLDRLQSVRTCRGTVVSPTFDPGGKVISLLIAIVADNGFFFWRNAFYDAGGRLIIGLPESAAHLAGL